MTPVRVLIADDQDIVRVGLANLMRKLEARNRVEIALWAHETD